MASFYIFEDVNEQRQLDKAKKIADFGITPVEVHYHHAWYTDMTRVPCNEKCDTNYGGVIDEHVTDQ